MFGDEFTEEQITSLVVNCRPTVKPGNTLYDRFAKSRPLAVSREAIVYFIRCNQFVKIGFTTRLKSRLDGLQSGNPYPLQVIGYVPGGPEVELSIHQALAKNRNVGERFRLSKSVRQMIVRLLDEAEPEPGHIKAADGVKIEPLDERLRIVDPVASRRIRWVKRRGQKFIVPE